MQISEAISQSELSRLDTEVLLAYTISKTREYLLAHPEQILTLAQQETFNKLCALRKSGTPIAQITNKKEFFGIELFVNEHVLIPRPETELLVEEIIHYTQAHPATTKAIEIGTGSGNISIALAKTLPSITIIAGEVSPEALKVATKNVTTHNLASQITLRQSDLLSQIPEPADIIVANLPYIGTETHNFVSQEASSHEPHVALFGGHDGLQLYAKLFDQILARPKSDQPQLILGEVGFSQRQPLTELINHKFPNSNFEIKTDLAGLDRYFVISM